MSVTEHAAESTVVTSPEAFPPADPRRWLILAVLCSALLIVGIDGTIVNIALPTLVREIGASNSQLQWIVDAYTIVFASFLLIAGNTGDRLGRKRCLLAGLVVFAVGSFGCSQVKSAEPLIVLRGVQGLGAAFIMPATLSIITNVFRDANERSRAIALWAGVSGLGIVIGPLAGGFLLEHFWWGAIFLINVPIAVVAIAAVVLVVPESKDAHAPALDFVGTVLSTIELVRNGISQARLAMSRRDAEQGAVGRPYASTTQRWVFFGQVLMGDGSVVFEVTGAIVPKSLLQLLRSEQEQQPQNRHEYRHHEFHRRSQAARRPR